MSFETWLAFVASAAVLLLIPGQTALCLLSLPRGHDTGDRWPVALAVSAAHLFAFCIVVGGLGAWLAEHDTFRRSLQGGAALYLVWLGITCLRPAARTRKPVQRVWGKIACARWRQAFSVTLLNPKSLGFFVAVVPEFLSGVSSTSTATIILGLTFGAMAALNAGMLLGIGAAIATRPWPTRAALWVDRLRATLFLCLAAGVAGASLT